MAKSEIQFDGKDFEVLARNLKALSVDIDPFFKDCSKVLSGELYKRAVKKTPVRQRKYPRKSKSTTASRGTVSTRSRKKSGSASFSSGTLRRGWERKQELESGKTYRIIIRNNVEYADYVENGHRVRKKQGYGWVEPRYMMKDARDEVEEILPSVVESRLERMMKR